MNTERNTARAVVMAPGSRSPDYVRVAGRDDGRVC